MSASRHSLRRPKPFRPVKRLVLIVCEGEKTEPQYFARFRQAKRLSALTVEIVPGDVCGSNPKSIVKHARQRAREGRRQKLPFDDVWCVFDRDDHQGWNEALKQALDNSFKVAFSNPCFELWVLLHYEYQSAQIDREAVVKRVRKHLPEYSKSLDVYDTLLEGQANAMTHAEKLRAYHKGNCDPETHNPSTSVDILVKYLNELDASRCTPPGSSTSVRPAGTCSVKPSQAMK